MPRQASNRKPSGEIAPAFFFLLSVFPSRRARAHLKQNCQFCFRASEKRLYERLRYGR